MTELYKILAGKYDYCTRQMNNRKMYRKTKQYKKS